MSAGRAGRSPRLAAVVAILLFALVVAGCSLIPSTGPGAGSSPPPTGSDAAPSTATATPAPTVASTPPLKPTPVPVPPKPTGVSFDEQDKELARDPATWWTPRYELTYTVTWEAPRSEGVTIRVYGVTECLSMPTPAPEIGEGPCLVEHTRLPSSALRLVATAPASAGAASWTAEVQAECGWGPAIGPDGTSFSSVVLAAYSASGHSIFAIAEPGSWCTSCAVC